MNAARAKGRKPGRPALDQEKLDAAMLFSVGFGTDSMMATNS
jgi:hypothetical protein